MKKTLTIICLLFALAGAGQVCKDYNKGGYRLSYNRHYKKYAVVRIDSALVGYEITFLLKDRTGRYGLYGSGWDENSCWTCGDPKTSLFTNPCDAIKFLLTYFKWREDNQWE